MARQRRLHRQRSCRRVANFAEHQHLRILPDDAAEGALVGELAKAADFDLCDAGQAARSTGSSSETMLMPADERAMCDSSA